MRLNKYTLAIIMTMNQTIINFKDLEAWRVSFELAKEIYQLTSLFPKNEQFGLVDQMKRSSVSIPSNIAEGYGRWSKLDYSRFCRIAYGSAAELETQILLAKELNLAASDSFLQSKHLINQTQRLLNGLIRSLLKSTHTPNP